MEFINCLKKLNRSDMRKNIGVIHTKLPSNYTHVPNISIIDPS